MLHALDHTTGLLVRPTQPAKERIVNLEGFHKLLAARLELESESRVSFGRFTCSRYQLKLAVCDGISCTLDSRTLSSRAIRHSVTSGRTTGISWSWSWFGVVSFLTSLFATSL